MLLSRALLFTRASGNGLTPHPAEVAGLVLVRLCRKERGKEKSGTYCLVPFTEEAQTDFLKQ